MHQGMSGVTREALKGDSVVGTVTAVNVGVNLINWALTTYVFKGQVPAAVEAAIVLLLSAIGSVVVLLWAYYSRKLNGNLPANPAGAPSAESAPPAPPLPAPPGPAHV